MVIKADSNDIRIDKYLAMSTDLSRSRIQKLIDDDKVLVNKKRVNASYKVKVDDEIEITDTMDYSTKFEAEDIDLDIVYEDEYLLIINKPSGMVVHPAPGHYSDTLVNALLYSYDIEDDGLRPGIVHRLDKDTSGLMVVALDAKIHESLSSMIKDKKVKRHYIALVEGVINHDSGTIDAPIGRDPHDRKKMTVTDINGKEAVTHFKVLKRYKNNTLLECILDTGRTHQIRVHMKYINHPIVNDPLYNKKKADSFGQYLHSKSIEFIHPVLNKKLFFEQDIPQEFKDKLKELETE